MTPEQTALARKLVVHPRWEWDDTIVRQGVPERAQPATFGSAKPLLPDLTDGATGGVLLSMLQPSNDRAVLLHSYGDGWVVLVIDRKVLGEGTHWLDGDRWHEYRGATLAEACARVLLVLWENDHG